MADIFFLSGLPRSGSTLLGSLMGQNPDFTATPTSPFLDLLCFTNQAFNAIDQKYTYDKEVITDNVYRGIVTSFYSHIKTKYILDKHRGHPKNIVPIKKFINPNPKVLCSVRPIAEIICSYIQLIEKNKQSDNFIDNTLKSRNTPINTTNRAKCLWDEYIQDPYKSMTYGLKNHKENLFVVDYDRLVNKPEKTLMEIYKFLEIEPYKNHSFDNIENHCAEEKDAAWGLENLHNIRPKLEKVSRNPREILGSFLVDYYNKFNLVF